MNMILRMVYFIFNNAIKISIFFERCRANDILGQILLSVREECGTNSSATYGLSFYWHII